VGDYCLMCSESKALSAHPSQCIMVSMLDLLALYRKFESPSGQTKYNTSDVH
jgi:hypothetical protein